MSFKDAANRKYQSLRARAQRKSKQLPKSDYFVAGAEWGYRQAIEQLRSPEAKESKTNHVLQRFSGPDSDDRGIQEFLADWLEKKLKGNA